MHFSKKVYTVCNGAWGRAPEAGEFSRIFVLKVVCLCGTLPKCRSEHESYLKYRNFLYLLLLMAVNMRKVVIKILQGSAVTQTVLGGLTIHLSVANFL